VAVEKGALRRPPLSGWRRECLPRGGRGGVLVLFVIAAVCGPPHAAPGNGRRRGAGVRVDAPERASVRGLCKPDAFDCEVGAEEAIPVGP
jgi:hypothetical protein